MEYPVIAQPQSAFAPTFARGGMADAAQAVQSQGRGKDTMLVHMTPNEVRGLQALAMSQGGSLTINPATGLPEAGILDAILPIAAGFALGPAGFALMSAPMAALTVGGVTALATGDLMKGLSAGLGAFGGASMGQALATTGAEAQSLAALPEGGMTVPSLPTGAEQAAGNSLLSQSIGSTGAPQMSMAPWAQQGGSTLANLTGTASTAAPTMMTPAQVEALRVAPSFSTVGSGISDLGTTGGFSRFGSAFVDAAGGPMGTTLAATGLASPILGAMQPEYAFPETTVESNYAGPYKPSERQVRYPGADRRKDDSSEFLYFTPTNPYPGFVSASAAGGTVGYQEGGTVEVPAAPERMLNMPAPTYQHGTAPEFNYNFRPVEVYTLPSAAAPQQAEVPFDPFGAFGFPTNTAAKASPNGDAEEMRTDTEGAGLGSIFGGIFKRNREKEEANYTDLSKYKYDAATQRMVPTTTQMAQGGLAALNAFSKGGVNLRDGAFVVDARTVSEIGNGSSEAGQERLAKMGGRPIKGPGDGVSDSIPATIGGTKPARVARDEVIFDPEAVKRLGKGNAKAGADKLYAMMERVHKERKKAKRGQDSNADKHIPA